MSRLLALDILGVARWRPISALRPSAQKSLKWPRSNEEHPTWLGQMLRPDIYLTKKTLGRFGPSRHFSPPPDGPSHHACDGSLIMAR
ncbi:MAG: hypothetical protein ACP5O0_00715 [Acidimicrobiales bacterium]